MVCNCIGQLVLILIKVNIYILGTFSGAITLQAMNIYRETTERGYYSQVMDL